MRNEFVRTLTKIAREDSRVVLITGDLGFGVLDKFAEELPKQYVNAGVAEQNMTGLAAGMALEGKIVFTYSIANFPTFRCLEQLRNDACYHKANLKVVALGGGFAYGPLGFSHHATEDLAVMRALPNMMVVSPADPMEVRAATEAIYRTPGTCYLRLGRGGEPALHQGPTDFRLGRAIKVLEGEGIALLATGAILKNALEASRKLAERGRQPAVYSVHTLKPIDAELIKMLAKAFKLIVTVEEHSTTGGLGSAVAEVLAQLPNPKATLRMIGLAAGFSTIVGDQEYLRTAYGMSPPSIVESISGAVTD